jgi:hypothetical protein
VADVYVIYVPGGTRKIFDMEASARSQAVHVDDADQLYKGGLNFCRRLCFVSFVLYQE